jgi:hypothetical protein
MKSTSEPETKILDWILLLTTAVSFLFSSYSSVLSLAALAFFGRMVVFANRFNSKKKEWHEHRWRFVVVVVHSLALMVILVQAQHQPAFEHSKEFLKYTSALIALATIRILFVFEEQPFSRVHLASTVFGGGTLFCISDDWLNSALAFLSLSACAVSLVVSLCQEHSAAWIKREGDAQSFLSHALKQKFSGVGTAIEQVLEFYKSNNNNHGTENPLFLVLTCALEESRAGHDACHLRNVIKKLSQETYCALKSVRSFKETVNEWKESRSIVVLEQITFDCEQESENWKINLDWELLRLMLKEWTRKRSSEQSLLVTSSIQTENSTGTIIEFQLHLSRRTPLPKAISKIEEKLAIELGGRFVNPLLFTVCVQTLRDNPASPPNHSTDKTISEHAIVRSTVESDSFPPGLFFAFLDDNSLVRKNAERLVSKYLKSRNKSFVRGLSLAECMRFPQEVTDQKVDIVIYDLNLEFEDGQIRGTELAKQARARGFVGCQILHSAETEILISPNDELFDGVIEKTADRTTLLSGIKRAWGNHLRKRQQEENEQQPDPQAISA